MTSTTLRHPAVLAPEGEGRWLEVRFRGLSRSVLMPDRADLRQGLADIVPDWPTETASLRAPADRTGEVLAALAPSVHGPDLFDLSSIHTDAPLCGLRLASALCGLLADALTAHADETPGSFTLHCGAVRFGDRLVALTGPHRAGKSTLVARLTAEPDLAVFCDDVLPLDADGQGLALGVAPRLRLPLPEAASDLFRRHVAAHLGPADDRYGYLCAPTVARHGARAPLAALVVLDRRDGAPARLHRLEPDLAMRHLLARNFGSLGTAGDAFRLAEETISRATCLTLVYSDLEEAVTLLRRAFAGAGEIEASPPLPPSDPDPAPAPADIDPDVVWRRAEDAVIRRVGGSAFLWRPGDTMLWQMNPVAEIVWTALEAPGSARDLSEAMGDLFPGTPPARILGDVTALLGTLAAHELAAPSRGS